MQTPPARDWQGPDVVTDEFGPPFHWFCEDGIGWTGTVAVVEDTVHVEFTRTLSSGPGLSGALDGSADGVITASGHGVCAVWTDHEAADAEDEDEDDTSLRGVRRGHLSDAFWPKVDAQGCVSGADAWRMLEGFRVVVQAYRAAQEPE